MRYKGVYGIIIKGSVKQNILNLCAFNNIVTKYMNQKLAKLKKMYTDSHFDVRL